MNINHFFFIEVPVRILFELRSTQSKNNRKRAKIAGCTYSYYSGVIQKFKKANLVTITRTGRECRTYLTKKGEDLADRIILLNKQVEKYLQES